MFQSALIFSLLYGSALTVENQESVTLRQVQAHVHGDAELIIAMDSNGILLAELSSPAWNLYGFEGRAETEEQIRTVQDVQQNLNDETLLSFSTRAKCVLDDFVLIGMPEIEAHGDEHSTDHHHDHDDEDHGEPHNTHSDTVASWTYTCQDPKRLNHVNFDKFFTTFPRLKAIDAQFADQDSATSSVLTPKSSRMKLSD